MGGGLRCARPFVQYFLFYILIMFILFIFYLFFAVYFVFKGVVYIYVCVLYFRIYYFICVPKVFVWGRPNTPDC